MHSPTKSVTPSINEEKPADGLSGGFLDDVAPASYEEHHTFEEEVDDDPTVFQALGRFRACANLAWRSSVGMQVLAIERFLCARQRARVSVRAPLCVAPAAGVWPPFMVGGTATGPSVGRTGAPGGPA